MNTYFEVKFQNSKNKKTFATMNEAKCAIEISLNEDRFISDSIVEKQEGTDKTVAIYKPEFSVKFVCVQIPQYQGKSIL